jgi:hypothetical protein
VGGTAQAVRFRVLGVPIRYRRTSCIDPSETGPIYHVYTRRSAGPDPANPPGYRSLRVRRAVGDAGPRLPNSLAEQFAEIEELPTQAPDPFRTLFERIETLTKIARVLPGRRPVRRNPPLDRCCNWRN